MNLRKKIRALLLACNSNRYDKSVAERKEDLFSNIYGEVLEIGAGTGSNIKYFSKNISYTAIEPNEYMHKYLQNQINKRELRSAQIIKGTAEHLPAENDSVDFVVSTLVLCSVENPKQVLSEVKRILRRGGRFLFLEHTDAPNGTYLRLLQKIVRPAWEIISDGCNPETPTMELIQNNQWNSLHLEKFNAPFTITSPQIMGRAEK